jgi:hypothetical protein
LKQHIENLFKNSEYFTAEIKKKAGFKMVVENPECTNVCFWFVPPSLRNVPVNKDYWNKLHQVAPKIKERMMKVGSMLILFIEIQNLHIWKSL